MGVVMGSSNGWWVVFGAICGGLRWLANGRFGIQSTAIAKVYGGIPRAMSVMVGWRLLGG